MNDFPDATAVVANHCHSHQQHQEVEVVSCAIDDDNHRHPTYRYNHYPRRSSSCYSSSNLVSYSLHQRQQWAEVDTNTVALSPSPTSMTMTMAQSSSLTTCISTSDSSSEDVSSPPPSPQQHGNDDERSNVVASLTRDEFSIQSALSMYQAFADYSVSSNNNSQQNIEVVIGNAECDTVGDDQWATTASIDEEDERASSNDIGNVHNSQDRNYNSNAEHDGQSWSSLDEALSNKDKTHAGESSNKKCSADSDKANDDGDDESITSLTSSPTPTNVLGSSTNFLHRHRRKITSLLLSMVTVGIYAHHRKSNQFRRRYYLLNGNHSNLYNLGQGKILNICRWLFRLLSPLTISNNLRQTMQSKSTVTSSQIMHPQKLPSSTPPSWNNVPITPLSHLLAMSKSGNIYKVILRGPVLSYLHSIQSSSPSISASSPSLTVSSSSSAAAAQPSNKQQRWSQTTLPSRNSNILNEIITTLLKHGCDDITTLPESLLQRILNGPAVMALPFAYLAVLYWMMRRLQRQQLDNENNGEGSSWKKGDGRHHPPATTTFEDVAGIDSSLQELSEVISYMRNPGSFHVLGAQPPRGILLHGPPGSGKTLLARAIAGEAQRCVDGIHHLGGNAIDCFVVCSGSEFVETYVGRGAARVRNLFQYARAEAMRNFKRRQRRQNIRSNSNVPDDEQIIAGQELGVVTRTMREVGDKMVGIWEGMLSLSPSSGTNDANVMGANRHQQPMAIIFVDEIDCLAKRRDSGFGLPSSLGGGGCDEREQTLNQLLTEMDGFETGDTTTSSNRVNVIVIAATNRPEVLDPAIMRPGRFDRHVRVNLPDARGREAILRVHARRIRWDRSKVDFADLPTHNFSGADLKNVVNEAALLAVRSGSSAVTQSHLLEAVQKVRDQLRHR
jgi:ATP-dependent Zn protease